MYIWDRPGAKAASEAWFVYADIFYVYVYVICLYIFFYCWELLCVHTRTQSPAGFQVHVFCGRPTSIIGDIFAVESDTN